LNLIRVGLARRGLPCGTAIFQLVRPLEGLAKGRFRAFGVFLKLRCVVSASWSLQEEESLNESSSSLEELSAATTSAGTGILGISFNREASFALKGSFVRDSCKLGIVMPPRVAEWPLTVKSMGGGGTMPRRGVEEVYALTMTLTKCVKALTCQLSSELLISVKPLCHRTALFRSFGESCVRF
jgi:hypothetical protein